MSEWIETQLNHKDTKRLKERRQKKVVAGVTLNETKSLKFFEYGIHDNYMNEKRGKSTSSFLTNNNNKMYKYKNISVFLAKQRC